MGKHYIPQAYLRNFQIPEQPGSIWLYDKQGGEPHVANIRKVAQSRDYYSPETEDKLARLAEAPANDAMWKLSRNEQLAPAERWNLAYYICVMLKRVPRRRRKAQEMCPEALTATMTEIRAEFHDMARQMESLDPAWVEGRLAELDAVEQKFSSELPQGVVDYIREPWPNKEMVDVVYRMVWRVLWSAGPQYFITGDNPVFLFDCFGLAQEKSEISFPLSTTKVLHGCWQGKSCGLEFMKAPQWLVKEVNRRLASETERFFFCHDKEPWLQEALAKPHPFLSRIVW